MIRNFVDVALMLLALAFIISSFFTTGMDRITLLVWAILLIVVSSRKE